MRNLGASMPFKWLVSTTNHKGMLLAGLIVLSVTACGEPPKDEISYSKKSTLEKIVHNAINKAQGTSSDTFENISKNSWELARAIASRLKNYPAEYNKPDTLRLGESTAVQFVIKTNQDQKFEPYFKGFEGALAAATVLVAKDVSAQLTGPPDRLQITLRGDKMRTILSPDPITWVWDVKPLKPGKAQVTLEVTSYIKSGQDTEPVPVRVLQDTWFVDARGLEWAKYQIEQIAPIQAFIFGMGGAVVAVLAWFGIKGWGKSKPDFET
jgi:hypothetical protein